MAHRLRVWDPWLRASVCRINRRERFGVCSRATLFTCKNATWCITINCTRSGPVFWVRSVNGASLIHKTRNKPAEESAFPKHHLTSSLVLQHGQDTMAVVFSIWRLTADRYCTSVQLYTSLGWLRAPPASGVPGPWTSIAYVPPKTDLLCGCPNGNIGYRPTPTFEHPRLHQSQGRATTIGR